MFLNSDNFRNFFDSNDAGAANNQNGERRERLTCAAVTASDPEWCLVPHFGCGNNGHCTNLKPHPDRPHYCGGSGCNQDFY